jgi:hypothetical protein
MAHGRNWRKSLVSVQIFVEGGAQGSAKNGCRQAFRTFFEKVIPRGSFRAFASGSRSDAFKDFCLALRRDPGEYNILLVDSEEAVAVGPWEHLAARRGDEWRRPAGSRDDQVHLMVQVMESWFLADRQTLADYYGQGFIADSLPRQPNIEVISKQDVFRALQHASKNTKTKGEYHKTRHGFDILELIDPDLVGAASNHAKRLLAVLHRETAS